MEKINSDKMKVDPSKWKEADQEFRDLEKHLTERISDLHEVKGGMQARHAYMYYRYMLWSALEKLDNAVVDKQK